MKPVLQATHRPLKRLKLLPMNRSRRQLEPIEDDSFVKPRSAPRIDFEIPAMDTRPEGCDAVLVVEGLLDANTETRRFCFVNSEQVNVVIGRGDADIAIEHAAISRTHARVESDGA